MKIPKHIINKFFQRARYGALVNKLDCEIMEWCKSQGLSPEECFESPYLFNSILLLAEPHTLSLTQLEWLKNYSED